MRTIFNSKPLVNEEAVENKQTYHKENQSSSEEESPIVKSLASHFAHYRPELLTQDKI